MIIFTATEHEMQEYSAIIQRIGQLDYERNELIKKLSEWERSHSSEENSD